MPDLIGRQLGEFQITEQIGKGGMATVYRAYQPSLDRDVAIKVLPAYYAKQDDMFLARFRREAKSIAKLRHPNILMVLSYGEDDGVTYIVMEYVDTGTLKERMKARRFSLKEAFGVLSEIGSALDYAHSKGVVHRDVKPSNILTPKEDWVLLTDFGLAKMVSGNSMLTQSGLTVGTPAYMSPEQGSGKSVDHRTDLYSLGVILYEMVVGELPFTAETPMAVVVKHITDPLPLPKVKNPNVPEALQKVILKSMAKDPDTRYQNGQEFIDALKPIVDAYPDWTSETDISELDPLNTKVVKDDIEKVESALPKVKIVEKPKPRPVITAPLVEKQKPSKKRRSRPGFMVGMIVIGIGLCAIISIGGYYLGSAYGFFPSATETYTPTPTEEVVEPTPTEVEEDQPSHSPNEPRVPNAPDNGPVPENIMFSDDFSNTDSGWDIVSAANGSTFYVDGQYHIEVVPDGYIWWANPNRQFRDVRVEVDTWLVGGTDDNAFGIICGFRDRENFIYTMISSDGFYSFNEVLNGEIIWLGYQGMLMTEEIALGGEYNHMRVDCVGDQITLYVNGSFVDQVTRENIPTGDVGLITQTFDEGTTTMAFDNFVVYGP